MEKLIFVYNADSGFLNTIKDTTHKALSPETYECNLCGLTYNLLSEKSEWSTFVKNLGKNKKITTVFLHKNELRKKYTKNKEPLPAVFIEKNNSLKLLISAKEINSKKSLQELINLVKKKINN
jgi:hypothetical protein